MNELKKYWPYALLGCVLVAGAFFWTFRGQPGTPSGDGLDSSVIAEREEELRGEYEEGLIAALRAFQVSIAESSDNRTAAATAAKLALLELTVPVSQKDLHLDLVLRLSAIEAGESLENYNTYLKGIEWLSQYATQ